MNITQLFHSHVIKCRLWAGLIAALWLSNPAAGSAGSADFFKTNSLSLAQLLKQWEGAALTEVTQKAEAGDALAQYYLGYCQANGLRMPPNPQAGIAWLERALQNGCVPAANQLGFLYQRGLLVSNDNAKAVYYYSYAAQRGDPPAQVNLGACYRDGVGVEKSVPEALNWFRQAAVQGEMLAVIEIGRFAQLGFGMNTNLSEVEARLAQAAGTEDAQGLLLLGLLYYQKGRAQDAFPRFLEAAKKGSTEAMIDLYHCYWQGDGVARDHKAAIQWLTQAASAGNSYAQCLLGYRKEHPEWQMEGANMNLPAPIWHEVVHWYRLSAEQYWTGGQYFLGLCYLHGRGVEQDEARGLELVRAAADQGLEAARNELIGLYTRGIGEPRNDLEKPIVQMERLKNQGDLMRRYQHGLGTERDLVAAARCLCELILEGAGDYSPGDLAGKVEFHPKKTSPTVAFVPTGDEHISMMRSPSELRDLPDDDLLRVLSLYLQAASGKDSAATEIGQMYRAGINTPKSSSKAWLWFSIAARNGQPEAQQRIVSVEADLNHAELLATQQQLPGLIQALNRAARAIQQK